MDFVNGAHLEKNTIIEQAGDSEAYFTCSVYVFSIWEFVALAVVTNLVSFQLSTFGEACHYLRHLVHGKSPCVAFPHNIVFIVDFPVERPDHFGQH